MVWCVSIVVARLERIEFSSVSIDVWRDEIDGNSFAIVFYSNRSFNYSCVGWKIRRHQSISFWNFLFFSKSKINFYFSPKCDAQAQDALEEIAAKVGVYYVSERILKLSSAEKSPKVYKKNMFFYMKNK